MEREHFEETKKKQLKDKISETEAKVQRAMKEKEEDMILKREIEQLKWQDREETVNRIHKINEYQRVKQTEKIEGDNERKR